MPTDRRLSRPGRDASRASPFSRTRRTRTRIARDEPTVAEIEGDLKLLAGKTHAVRTYSTLGTMGQVPALAKRHGIRVTLGAWLDTDRNRNEREIEQAIRLANKHRNVVRIMVGNEVLLRGDLARADLYAHLDHVRAATRQPVSTAEPWHVWIRYPELAEHVDFVAVHMLPYWEGVEVEAAVEYVVDKMALARADLSRQGDRHRRGGLAERRAHARIGRRHDLEPGALSAALSRPRAAGSATSTT